MSENERKPTPRCSIGAVVSAQVSGLDLKGWEGGAGSPAPWKVAYFETSRAFVTAGPLVSNQADEIVANSAFLKHVTSLGKVPIYFGTEHPLPKELDLQSVEIGLQPVWDPRRWESKLRAHRSLKEQVRRANAKNVTTEFFNSETIPHEDKQQIGKLIQAWQESKGMPPMQFVVTINSKTIETCDAIIVARTESSILGFLTIRRVYDGHSVLFENLLRSPDAPNGTVELLFDAGMKWAKGADVESVTTGLAPLAQEENTILTSIKWASKPLFDFEGLYKFKAKFRPDNWLPIFMGVPKGTSTYRAYVEVLRAFADGSLVHFGWRTLLHNASKVVWILALLLVPWTALLALGTTQDWFPSRNWQIGWISYDCLLFLGLTRLASRFRPWLARFLASAAGLDFAGGLFQLATFNIHQAYGAGWFLIFVSLLAPAFAATFLLAAARHVEQRKALS